MQAIILAGGFGTRLKEMVGDIPKPMAPIRQRPFLEMLMGYLREQGVDEVALCVHYMKETVRRYFGNELDGMPIAYIEEDEPLGTGGAIVNAFKQLQPAGPVIVLNGDSFVKVNYRALWRQHAESRARITMALRYVPDCSRFSEITLGNGKVVEYALTGGPYPGVISTGVYVMNPDLFEGSDLPEAFSLEKEFLVPRVPELQPNGFMVDDYFIDIGIPEDYLRACRELPQVTAYEAA